MAHVLPLGQTHVDQPAIRKISLGDLADAIVEGIDDFRAKPTHLYYLAFIYPLVTLGAFLVIFDYSLLPLVFPIISGSLLIGPFLTISLCEISRKREQGIDISAGDSGNFLRNPGAPNILLLGAFLVVLFFLWLGTALTIYAMTLGDPWQTVAPASVTEFVNRLLTTPEGWALIVVGNGVGLLFAIVGLCAGAISFPMLLDRPVSIATALQTSVRAVLANPVIMVAWGLVVGLSLAAAAVPFLVGLALVVPILGHATWHLYRKLVV